MPPAPLQHLRRLFFFALIQATITFAPAAELTGFAAASLSEALEELAPLYAKACGDTVRFNFGGSGT
jgi:ABC-type molybdate transport system substrate-binding protein